ncbi:MAG: hypothetical protein AB7U82_02525 [Blastocatellales bacterium]
MLFPVCLLSVPSVRAQTKEPASTSAEELHGGIEIGAKGIKSVAVRIVGDERGYSVNILNADILNTTIVQTKNGKFTPEAIRDTGSVTQRFYQRLRQDYRIPPEQIHIVGSSGLIGDNSQDLAEEVRKRTGQEMTFLDVETEAQLRIAGSIPRRYRIGATWYDNRGVAVLIDIGSGDTKGGYQLLRRVAGGAPEYDYITWGIPKGTVTFTNEISKAAGETADYQTFAKRAQALSPESVRAILRNEVARKPGLINRKRIYLSGGIVWTMMTLIRPEDRSTFTPVTADDITNFYNRAITNPEALLNPDLSRIRNKALRQEAEREVESVRNTFTPKNLIAGAEILRAVAGEMRLAGKQIYYARYGYLAWILSYVRLQAEK